MVFSLNPKRRTQRTIRLLFNVVLVKIMADLKTLFFGNNFKFKWTKFFLQLFYLKNINATFGQ